jgi:very-short-patch-repair endonuclease
VPFTYECAGCGKQGTKPTQIKTRAFCTRACYQRSIIKYPDRECLGCGVTFNPRRGPRSGPRIKNPQRKYCTRECFEASVRKWIECARCGKPFEVGRDGKGGRVSRLLQYCSSECHWPPTYLNCKTCGGRFRVTPSRAGAGAQFCSLACYRKHTGETMLEARVRMALEDLGIGFTQEYPVLGWAIDFALVPHKVAIEADGDYWHSISIERDIRRDAVLERAGWRMVRLSEAEVNATREPGRLILDRLRAATGLELADVA